MLNATNSLGFERGLEGFGIALIIFMVWSIFWKGLALWHAGRRGQGWWFLILLLCNTLGVLDLIYLFLVAKVPVSQLFKGKK